MALKPRGLLRRKGFTLIELMITVVIVSILAAIAYPSYVNSIRKSRRIDAKTALLDLASREERYFSTNNTYTADPSALGYSGTWPASIPSASQYNYALQVNTADTTTFTLQAAPNGDQVNDTCGTYTLNNTGLQGNTGSTSTSPCW